jgi:hypothetical protein
MGGVEELHGFDRFAIPERPEMHEVQDQGFASWGVFKDRVTYTAARSPSMIIEVTSKADARKTAHSLSSAEWSTGPT